jgi:hypothetical protein
MSLDLAGVLSTNPLTLLPVTTARTRKALLGDLPVPRATERLQGVVGATVR